MGPLRYKGDSGMLECEFCESTFTPAQVEEAYAAKQHEADEKAQAAAARAEAGEQSSFERMADDAAGASSVVTEDVIELPWRWAPRPKAPSLRISRVPAGTRRSAPACARTCARRAARS